MFKRIIRKDGTVIILVPKKDTKAVTFEVLYKVGSRQENLQNNGASHFVEHLMFKGTTKRPDTATISKELDSVGAEFNAFTGKDHTGYYITTDSGHLGLAADMLSDMINHSKFDKDDIDRERGVIVEEINMYEDNPMFYVEDVFENLLYQGSILGKSIAGPRANIQNMSRTALYNYYQKYYYNGNAVIGVAGKFNEVQVLKLIDKLFPIRKKQARVKIKPVSLTKQAQSRVEIIKRDLEQVQLMLGFPSLASNDKNYLASQMLSNILGGTMSSRLFLEIREKRGLCYFVRSQIQGYEDISSLAIQAGLNKEKIYDALQAIKDELNKIKDQGITAEELKRAKDNIRGRLILKLESASSQLNFLAGQEMLGQKIKDLETKLKELDKININQINNISKQIIKWSNSNLAIIGPFGSKQKFLQILKK
jgi:predicted Zn-dependent peptidase